MSKPKIMLCRATFDDIVDLAKQDFDVIENQSDATWTPDTLAAAVRGLDGIIPSGGEQITAALLEQNPQLKAVCNQAVGYNNIDVAAATRLGVMVTNTPDVLNETTADMAWTLMMAAARRVGEGERWLRAGQWKKAQFDLLLGADVHGATLGIIGMGRIGQAVARRSMGFGMTVLYHNRSRLSPALEQHANHARWVDKETLLRQADHVVLVLPYSAESKHTIGAAELALMKPTATLTNIARGGIVDDLALIAALRNGKIAAAGLDVFENEPAFAGAFLELDNVVMTPHIGSATAVTRRAMAHCALNNLKAALLPGQATPPNMVNPDVMNRPYLRRQ